MATPEGNAKEKLREFLKAQATAFPAFEYMLYPNPQGALGSQPGVPDYTMHYTFGDAGHTMQLEAKARDNTPSPQQRRFLERVHRLKTDAVCIWADNPTELAYLWLLMASRDDNLMPPVLKLQRLDNRRLSKAQVTWIPDCFVLGLQA